MDSTDKCFIEPPHRHNQNDLAAVVAWPTNLDYRLGPELKNFLEGFYTATSIAFASLTRQRALHREWVKLNAGENVPVHINYLRFNTTRRMRAEMLYFDDEVMPDWRHKAFYLRSRIPNLNASNLATWLSSTEDVVRKWQEECQRMEFTVHS